MVRRITSFTRPGEGAGFLDIDDEQAVVFKAESHNHPSFVEPYDRAATGVGGIIRDIFSMGAKPIASLDSLRFGDLDSQKIAFYYLKSFQELLIMVIVLEFQQLVVKLDLTINIMEIH